jgi:deoxycytidine triphosphate deaminase
MPFITIASGTLTTANPGRGFAIYFSPLHRENEDILPTAWLDLHLSGEDYQDCEKGGKTRKFNKITIVEKDGEVVRYYVTIPSRRAVRLWTEEIIGLNHQHTAVFTNIASRAKHGLLVTPGKIDPGYCPTRLLLVVSNQSTRTVRLYAGAKIAAIAFAKIDTDAKASKSSGHAYGHAYPDYEIGKTTELLEWWKYRDIKSSDIIKHLLFPALISILLIIFSIVLNSYGYLPSSLSHKPGNPSTADQITK